MMKDDVFKNSFKMSVKCSKLTSLLLMEHFGTTVQRIHDELVWGPKPFGMLLSNTKLPSAVIKKCLGVMIQYGFVSYEPGKTPNIAEYFLQPLNILLLLRYPRYLSVINKLLGDLSRLMVEIILCHGSITATNLFLETWKRIDEVGKVDAVGVWEKLSNLISSRYMIRTPSSSPDPVPTAVPPSSSELFTPPSVPLQTLLRLTEGQQEKHPDSDIFWRVNFDRIHQDMRDELLVSGGERWDDNVCVLIQNLLTLTYVRTDAWASHSNPIPFLELRDLLIKNRSNAYLLQFLEQYFKVIEDDSASYIRRYGESSSASVFVNFAMAFDKIASCVIESLVEQRFGPKAARVFRLVKCKKYMDQEQIQKMAMIPDKEAKQITYRLLQENFLQMMELKKGSGGPMNKNFYLFHVDFNQVVHVVLEMCYKSVYNTLSRAQHEKKENVRLMDKQEKLNAIADCMRQQGTDQQQIQELIDEWITPPERELLDSIKRMVEKLQLAELFVDETIFIIQLYIFYHTCDLKEKK